MERKIPIKPKTALLIRKEIDAALVTMDGELDFDTFRSVHSNCGDLQTRIVPNLPNDSSFYDHDLDANFYHNRVVLHCPKHDVSSTSEIDSRIY